MDMQDIRDREPNTVLAVKVLVVVAEKGFGEDWAAYWKEVEVPAGLTYWVSSDFVNQVRNTGTKLPADVSIQQFFPLIGGGPYRD